jgi:hypothetical protein
MINEMTTERIEYIIRLYAKMKKLTLVLIYLIISIMVLKSLIIHLSIFDLLITYVIILYFLFMVKYMNDMNKENKHKEMTYIKKIINMCKSS